MPEPVPSGEMAASVERPAHDLQKVNQQLKDLISTLRTSQARLTETRSAAPAANVAPANDPPRPEEVADLDRRRAQVELVEARQGAERAVQERDRLAARLAELEAEHRRLCDEFVGAQEENGELAQRCVVLEALHSGASREEVLCAIREIVINVIGSEELAIYQVGDGAARLADAVGRVPAAPTVPLGHGIIGRVAAGGPLWVAGRPACPEDPEAPDLTACIPLRGPDGPVGAVVIWRLLGQKAGLGRLDQAVFELLERHAGKALSAWPPGTAPGA